VSSAGQAPLLPWARGSQLNLVSSSADHPQQNLAREKLFPPIAAQMSFWPNKVLSRLDKAALSESRDQQGRSEALAGELRAWKWKGGV
jgi:hypothetical protein